MEAWQDAPLTEGQRPVLLSGELECLLVPSVSIRTLKAKTGHEKGQLYLTTHRVVWLEAVSSTSMLMFRGKRRAIALPHAHVRAVESHSKGGAVRSAKLKVELVSPGGQALVVAVHSHGAADALCHRWRDALAQRAWVPPPAAPSTSSSSATSSTSTFSSSSSASTPARPVNFTTSSAGVSGLIRTRDEQARATDAALAEAFTDLNALMGKAKDLVGLAERFRVEASRQHEGGGGVTEEESNAFNNYLLSLGIATPVTKQSAGALFHSELARQLCDFLAKPLQHAGGNMSLADVYCLFNRARGTELISPEDLYRACVLLEPLGLPLRLRKFDSGVMVIQPAGQTDAEIAGKVEEAVRASGPMTAVDLAALWRISLPLAKEHLTTAERAELLCRDESFEGLVFYPNIFTC